MRPGGSRGPDPLARSPPRSPGRGRQSPVSVPAPRPARPCGLRRGLVVPWRTWSAVGRWDAAGPRHAWVAAGPRPPVSPGGCGGAWPRVAAHRGASGCAGHPASRCSGGGRSPRHAAGAARRTRRGRWQPVPKSTVFWDPGDRAPAPLAHAEPSGRGFARRRRCVRGSEDALRHGRCV